MWHSILLPPTPRNTVLIGRQKHCSSTVTGDTEGRREEREETGGREKGKGGIKKRRRETEDRKERHEGGKEAKIRM